MFAQSPENGDSAKNGRSSVIYFGFTAQFVFAQSPENGDSAKNETGEPVTNYLT